MDCCCNDDHEPAPTPSTSHPPGRRRITPFLQWALPITTLALIPKCPACVAAYVLLFTGLGLSLPAAAAIRWTLITVSLAALTFLLLRAALRRLSPST